MAIAVRTGEETRQVQMVCLDELVAAEDVLRRVERLVEWATVRDTAAPYYSDVGRPAVDPVVLVKLFLVAALRGMGSMRETLRVAEVDLSIRRFLGYGLTEPLPHHATLSYAQCVRFAQSSVFEQLFTQVLARCRDAGLLDGRRLVVDATHVEANAALKSLRAELTVIDGDGHDGSSSPQRPQLALAEPRSGPTPKRRASNATAVSISDPDAKLRHKPGQRPHLVHRAQVATDPKARVIVAVHAEPATGHEGAALGALIDRARWARHAVSEVGADQGYASDAVYTELERRGVTAYIPPQPNMLARPGGPGARARCKTPAGVSAAIARMAHGEGAINELKNCHSLDRARCRGTPKMQIQLLLAATAVNLKRLTRRLDANSATRHHDSSQLPAGSGHAAGGLDTLRAAIHGHVRNVLTCLTWLRRLDQTSSSTGS